MTETKEFDTPTAVLAIAFVITLPFALLFDGYVISRLWAWFVATRFDVGQLSVATAAGLSLIFAYLRVTIKPKDTTRSKTELLHASIWQAWGVPVFTLALGRFLVWWGSS